MVLLAVRNDRFRFAELVEHDDELPALDLLDLAGEEVADASRELVADARALAFADPLDDALLGRLDRGTSEDGEVDRLFHHVAGLEALVERLGVLDGDLVARIFDRFHDGFEEHDLDVALAVVDLDFGLNVRAVLLGEGGEDSVLEQRVQLRAIELFCVRYLAKRGQDFRRADHPGLLVNVSAPRRRTPTGTVHIDYR